MSVKYNLDALQSPQEIVKQLSGRLAPLPNGRSHSVTWPGGDVIVKATGSFFAAEGISVSIELWHSTRRADGILDRATIVRTFYQPGENRLNLPPGEFYFITSGPQRAKWDVHVQASAAPPTPKATTTEQRLAALEQAQRAPLEATPPALVQ